MAAWTAVRIKPVAEDPIPGQAARKEFHVGRPGRASEIWYVTNAGGLNSGAAVITAGMLKGVRHVQVLDSAGAQITAATWTLQQPPEVAAPVVTFNESTLGAGTAGFVFLFGNH